MKKKILSLITILIFVNLLSFSEANAQLPIGSIAQNQLVIDTSRDGTKVIPLPPGVWTVVYSARSRGGSTGNGNHYIDIALIENVSGVMRKSLTVRINDDADTHKTFTDEPCKRTNALHKNDYGTRLWEQRCLLVSHVTNFVGTDNKISSAFRSYLMNNNLNIPKTVFGMSYTQFDRYGSFMQIRFRFNPAAYGFMDTNTEYNFSPWHKDVIQSDQARAQFASRVVSYSEAYANALQLAFNKSSAPFMLQFDAPAQNLSVDELNSKCTEIGFKPKTNAHRNCVTELQNRVN
jgi:hypothetical protein